MTTAERTILIAEDEPSVRQLVGRVLRRDGYVVLEAANGKAALAVAGQHDGPIDLLLTDVVMPELGGPELKRQLAPLRPALRVLYMSGYTRDSLALEIGDPGVAFVQKPMTPQALVRAVRGMLDGTGALTYDSGMAAA